jgi:hypothetical protein
LDRIVEKRSDGLVRALALEHEDDLSLGQENGMSVERLLKIRPAQSGVFGEKGLSSLLTIGFHAGNKNKAIHGGSLLSTWGSNARGHLSRRSGRRRRCEREHRELGTCLELRLAHDVRAVRPRQCL